jgi:hypothetical protein
MAGKYLKLGHMRAAHNILLILVVLGMQAMDEQMPENAWIEYEYWKEGARDTPSKFTKVPRFQRVVRPI